MVEIDSFMMGIVREMCTARFRQFATRLSSPVSGKPNICIKPKRMNVDTHKHWSAPSPSCPPPPAAPPYEEVARSRDVVTVEASLLEGRWSCSDARGIGVVIAAFVPTFAPSALIATHKCT